jgi:hypothetical protein
MARFRICLLSLAILAAQFQVERNAKANLHSLFDEIERKQNGLDRSFVCTADRVDGRKE